MGLFLLSLAVLVIIAICLVKIVSSGDRVDNRGGSEKTWLVIIVKDQEPWIEGFIRKLFRIMKNTSQVEVTVVDDCSQDGTPEVLNRLQKYYPFEFVPVKAGSNTETASKSEGRGAEGKFAGAMCFDLSGLKGKELLNASLFCHLSHLNAGKSRLLSK